MEDSTFERKNYSTHMMEDVLRNFVEPLNKEPDLRDEARAFESYLRVVAGAVKFMLPPDGLYLEKDTITQDQLEMMKLPYPAVTLEFEATGKSENSRVDLSLLDHQSTSSRRVILCVDAEKDGRPGITLYSAAWIDEHRQWAVCPVIAHVPYDTELRYHKPEELPTALGMPSFVLEKIMARKVVPVLDINFLVFLPKILALTSKAQGVSTEVMTKLLAYELGQDLTSVIDFCNVVNCSNVEQLVFPPPAQINKKRVEREKLPFYEYRTLTIKPGLNYRLSSASEAETDRASPRQHLRRGHIRKLIGERRVWVRPHMVGDPGRGFIEKDYKVEPSGANTTAEGGPLQ